MSNYINQLEYNNNTYDISSVDVINVNRVTETEAYETKIAARESVPQEYKHSGLIATYFVTGLGWITEQFTGTAWNTADEYWKSMDDVSFDNTGTSYQSTNVQDVLKEIDEKLAELASRINAL